MFALLSLGTKFFLSMRLSQSLESCGGGGVGEGGKKKKPTTPLLLNGDLKSQQGPVSSGRDWQV